MAPKKSWQRRDMTAVQYKQTLTALGINVAQAGRFLGVSERTSHRYIRSETPIPEAHALLLRAMVELGAEPEVPPWESERRVVARRAA